VSWALEIAGEVPGQGLDALPYGAFVTDRRPGHARLGIRIGGGVLDLTAAAPYLLPQRTELLRGPTLDALMAAGPAVWAEVRAAVASGLSERRHADQLRAHLLDASDVRMQLAFTVADYVDFYSSEQHATNVGAIFRPGAPALPAAWRHLPIGYHGRAGTVVVSGTDVVRPLGWRRDVSGAVSFGPTRRLDLEAEVGFVVGAASAPGAPVRLDDFGQHVFGVVLLDDWSARDIQAFEYVPLGPFLGKSFATSVSAWVLPLAALEAARVAPPARDPRPGPPLDDEGAQPWGFDLAMEVDISGSVVSRPAFASMYWTAAQQLAHLTSNGAPLRTGDLLGSGTVSGADPGQWGSLLELSWDATRPVVLEGGGSRTYLEDGDHVTLRAWARSMSGGGVTLGEVHGRVVPARSTT
jgi:fumarylacetoacetase